MNTTNDKTNHLDLTALRAKLKTQRGKQYWRSLEELANSKEFQESLHNEFAPTVVGKVELGRRDFLKLMGASLLLAGVNACTRQPEEKIFPYVKPPEQLIPGKPLYFATANVRGGYAYGILVESHEGRPTKVEGNPEHPASLGATDVFSQASVLTLYDPDRSQVVRHLGEISTWEAFVTAISTALEGLKAKKGEGLRLLTETITSPALAHQLQTILTALPAAKWHQYEPANRDNAREGSRLAFGEYVETQYRLDQADVILSLDSDFLMDLPGSLRYAREFTARRRVHEKKEMNRLYAIESTPTLTGTMADHRRTMRASEIESFARALAKAVGVAVESNQADEWISAVARDLQKHRGASLVVAGEQQPPFVHALAHAMNHALGNAGRTVIYTAPVEAKPVNQTESLRELVADMEAGKVEMLLMLGGNPVYNAPADFNFREKLDKVKTRVHLSLYEDETSEFCHWHIPEAHSLETWGDARAYDGTVSIIQPLIAPLYSGKSAHEVLAVFTGQAGRSSHDLVRDYWKAQNNSPDFEKLWQTWLHDGLIAGTTLSQKTVKLQATSNQHPASSIEHQATSIEIIFRPDPHIADGRFANNGWLQELPKPLTKLTWDNAALLSPRMAERMRLSNEEVVELKHNGRSLKAPVWIMPGHPDNAVTVHFGYGRTRGGKLGTGTGFNAYALRTSEAAWFGSNLEINKTGQTYPLAATQTHHSMENRRLVRAGTLTEYEKHPEFVHEMEEEFPRELTLYPEHKYESYLWGMTIDLNSCIGCNACTIACQAENNISVVGKEQVRLSREMHWIRIDRYYEGDLDDPDTYHQPVTCMHCENAPCEPVCPVGATVHSDEGLNEMVYNRCIGTRYCSNNCPYKVRRFNFLLYSDFETPSLKLQRNPDVTVRSRGVMEKCTYCVQRINEARITAKKEDRQIRDGEIVTACQQVCPTQAIAFGDMNDPNSQVSRLKASKLNYGLLTHLNTRPHTTYLAKLRNPNPELAEEV
ncbi:MAG: TAT-variant-translocated molybdopterin oxidoreductase [candidate division KSB1 bacterium]|nr:TAT-variant-translocated molybdopterin oxidoreductase [candidate division KSB1 bacterium]MDZ7365511.1 TAT-variant-translocated molybdopterin oxidoreductase [candidate division KSB1 bacterium]MDZ7403614.1 TAT-variant-translocated molybdopterin oxidoreductase [candidate division KSB1 bacterium]